MSTDKPYIACLDEQKNTVDTLVRALALCFAIGLAAACHLEGRSKRAERLLRELDPKLMLGETLRDARRARPELGVRHPGDSPNLYAARDSEPPRAVAVIVWPAPALGERASPDAIVEAVELVMGPRVAGTVQQRVTQLLGVPVQALCAGQSLEQTDRVAVWELGRRGGVVLTFPDRRPDGVEPTSRLFIYTSGWQPERSLSGFGRAACSASM